MPGPRAPGRAARRSRVHQGLRCRLLAPSRVPCCHRGALQGVRVPGFVPSPSVPLPPLTAGLARLWRRLCRGWKQNFGGIPGTESPIWGQQLRVRVWGCVSCQHQGGGCWRTGTGPRTAGAAWVPPGRARGSSSAASSRGSRCPVAHPAGFFLCAMREPVPAPGVGTGRGVGLGPCPWLFAPSLWFCSPPVGSALHHEAALSRAASPPSCTLHFSVWQQTGAVIHLAGALRGAEAGGREGKPAWGCWWPPARRPPAVPAVVALILCVRAGIQVVLNAKLPQAGLAEVCLQPRCREGKQHLFTGGVKAWGGHCADVPARRGVPVLGAPCPGLLGTHPALQQPQGQSLFCQRFLPPQGSLSGSGPQRVAEFPKVSAPATQKPANVVFLCFVCSQSVSFVSVFGKKK